MMKKFFFLIFVNCIIGVAYAGQSMCIRVSETSINEKQQSTTQTYTIVAKNHALYLCDKNASRMSDKCSLLFGKVPAKDTYSTDEHWANEYYHSMRYLKGRNIRFDSYNVAYDYAHSLNQIIAIAENNLQNVNADKPIPFCRNRLYLDFAKINDRFEIGSYPNGILRPINYLFINDTIKNVEVIKRANKVSTIKVMTDKNQRFKYKLYYKNDMLVQSEILFQSKIGLPWEKDTIKTYRYFNCE